MPFQGNVCGQASLEAFDQKYDVVHPFLGGRHPLQGGNVHACRSTGAQGAFNFSNAPSCTMLLDQLLFQA